MILFIYLLFFELQNFADDGWEDILNEWEDMEDQSIQERPPITESGSESTQLEQLISSDLEFKSKPLKKNLINAFSPLKLHVCFFIQLFQLSATSNENMLARLNTLLARQFCCVIIATSNLIVLKYIIVLIALKHINSKWHKQADLNICIGI